MFLWIVPLCCAIGVVKIRALPTAENFTQLRTLNPDQCKSCTQLDDIVKRTMDWGLVALEQISEAAANLGSFVSDVASDFVSTGLKHVRQLVKASHKMLAAHLKRANRFGKDGFKLLEELLSSGGDFFIDSLSKLPMAKQRPAQKEECGTPDRVRSLQGMLDL